MGFAGLLVCVLMCIEKVSEDHHYFIISDERTSNNGRQPLPLHNNNEQVTKVSGFFFCELSWWEKRIWILRRYKWNEIHKSYLKWNESFVKSRYVRLSDAVLLVWFCVQIKMWKKVCLYVSGSCSWLDDIIILLSLKANRMGFSSLLLCAWLIICDDRMMMIKFI